MFFRLVDDPPEKLHGHVEWPGSDEVCRKVCFQILGAYIAHFAVEVAEVVHAKYEPVRAVIDVAGEEFMIEFLQGFHG